MGTGYTGEKNLDAVFIADLHLTPEAASTAELAEQFLTTVAPAAHKLFILGDLVEYWVGDDAYDGSLERVFSQLAALNACNTTCYLMHGNRDFLLGENFARQFNCELITQDQYLLPLSQAGSNDGQSNLLLMHGDTLCTDDHEYQGMRKLLRSSQWQEEFLALSADERHRKAQQIRKQSVDKTAQKNDDICDVNSQTVVDEMLKQGVTHLLHGHTHRPAVHSVTLNSTTTGAHRWVLGDWHPSGAIYATQKDHQIELRHWPDGTLYG